MLCFIISVFVVSGFILHILLMPIYNTKSLFDKIIVNKHCSYENVECLSGCTMFFKKVSSSDLYSLEYIYIFTEEVLNKNGNAEQKKSLLKLDNFLGRTEHLDFKCMSYNERVQLLLSLTTNFGNTCKEAQCVLLGEITEISHPIITQIRAVYGLQGQDNWLSCNRVDPRIQ